MRAARLLLMTMAIGAAAARGSAADSQAILVLHAYGHDTASRFQIDATLSRAFRERADVRVDLYIETLDPNRFDESEMRMTRDYLRGKYGRKNIAAIVAVYDRALAFLLDQREPLFPGVPIAALLSRYPQSRDERVAVIWTGNVIVDSTALALRLHPRTRQIAIIDGALNVGASDPVHAEVTRQIEVMGPRVPVVLLRDLALDDLIARVEALPPETIVMIFRQTIGRRGAPIGNGDAVGELTRIARVPIYVVTDQFVGVGAVGGVVISYDGLAIQLANLAFKLAKGERSISPAEASLVPMLDWRQLRRWNVDDDLLPPESIVRFRELGLWEQYRWYVTGALIVCVTQSGLIAGLLISRRRRRLAEVALQSSESALSTSAGEVQTLAGRLIAAQEVERTRIARELHDDLSQKLALLSIEIDHLVCDAERLDSVIPRARAAAARAAEISTSVHNLSHELHPARLEMVGLTSALEGLCEEMSRAHLAIIEFKGAPITVSIHEEVVLCLFRVTQEALRNVVKHSGAHEAQVELSHVDGMLELHVIDSGRGFSPEAAMNGLGLVSMRERVGLLGGEIAMESRVGAGYRIDVRIPVLHAEAQKLVCEESVTLSKRAAEPIAG